MATPVRDGREIIDIGGVRIELLAAGSGPNVLFLHGGLWLADESAFEDTLARKVRLVCPSHPGFGASSEPGSLASPDDLAYFYLDLIDTLGLDRPVIAGASLGGWIAAEIATKCGNDIAGLVLVDALGIRPGAPTDRPIVDIFGTPDLTLAAMAYKNPSQDAGNLRAINDDDELRRRLRARDALAWYGWQPYMHNPRLQGRLHRIKAPTLVLWGDSDGIAGPEYGRTYAAAIPGAQFEIVANAGHMAHVEQPEAVASRIAAFAQSVTKSAAALT